MASRLLRTLAPLAAAIVLASCALIACVRGGADHRPAAAASVPVKVARVGFDEDSGTHYVTLLNQRGDRGLEIMIGPDEARSILFELHGVKPERPLTSDLLRAIVERTGAHVARVEITDLRDRTYYASIDLDGGRRPIDSRPSDAIALAVGVDAPIYVAARLMRPEAIAAAAAPDTARALGVTVQALTPDLAEYFAVAASGGVLVADFSAGGAQAGLRRGDIVTAVDGQSVHTPGEFAHAARAANLPLSLTIRRDGRTLAIKLAASTANAATH